MKIDETSIRPKVLHENYSELLSSEIHSFFIDTDTVKLKKEIAVWVKCPACDVEESQHYLSKEGLQLHKCEQCGLVFMNPRPNENAMLKFFSKSKAIDVYSEMVEKTKVARKELIFNPLADFIVQNFGGGKLLEVGCGSGLLLDVLAEKNNDWSLKGVETSGRAVEICMSKGLDVFHGGLEDFDDTTVYDLIVFWAVFDHFFDPYKIVKKAHALLKRGGSILIGSMNIEGFDSMVLGKDNEAFTPPERQNFFGEKSMGVMLKRSGFKDVRVKTTGKLDLDIVKNYWLRGGQNGRTAFLERLVYSSDITRSSFQEFLMKNNLSGHMTVIATKD
jgi:2-polyprenyl-3-methyl-5-hydroxy-6-metoxy-1,4-benzoquinol methylase